SAVRNIFLLHHFPISFENADGCTLDSRGTMASPANLILIQSDNHSRKILGCYDHEIVKTPTLDKLASRGIRFGNAYTASPLCVPARAAMATGRFRIKPDIGTMLSHMMQGFRAGCIEFGNRDTRSWASASSITAAVSRTTASAKNSLACICTAVGAPYEICCAASTASCRALMMRAGTFTRSGRVPAALTTRTMTG